MNVCSISISFFYGNIICVSFINKRSIFPPVLDEQGIQAFKSFGVQQFSEKDVSDCKK